MQNYYFAVYSKLPVKVFSFKILLVLAVVSIVLMGCDLLPTTVFPTDEELTTKLRTYFADFDELKVMLKRDTQIQLFKPNEQINSFKLIREKDLVSTDPQVIDKTYGEGASAILGLKKRFFSDYKDNPTAPRVISFEDLLTHLKIPQSRWIQYNTLCERNGINFIKRYQNSNNVFAFSINVYQRLSPGGLACRDLLYSERTEPYRFLLTDDSLKQNIESPYIGTCSKVQLDWYVAFYTTRDPLLLDDTK